MYDNKRKENQAEKRRSCRKEIELNFITFNRVKNENEFVLYILLIYIDLLPSNRINLNYIFLYDKIMCSSIWAIPFTYFYKDDICLLKMTLSI